MNLLECVLFLLLLVENKEVEAVHSKEAEGYAEGFVGNCPGVTKPALITARSLKDLGIVVAGGDGTPNAYRRLYNYYQAKEMANDPHLNLKNKKTVCFVSGFLDHPSNVLSSTMAKAYRLLGYNVLLISANKFVTIHFPLAVRLMPVLGKHLAEMLTNLTAAGMDPKHFELAGISLGGQLISFVAKSFQQLTGRNVSQLTALDPSGPCFRHLGPDRRVDETDADFVQIIHTNIDAFGMAIPAGHVNYFINGGEYQPSDIYWMPCGTFCSHIRAYMIWIVTLSHPGGFVGLKCDSIQQARTHQCYDRMPRETRVISNTNNNSTNKGLFYVATDNNWPYYLGSRGLRKENEFWSKHVLEWNKEDVMRI